MKDEENKMQSAAPEQQAQPEQTQPESEPAADAAQPGTENEPKAETTATETPDKKKRPLWRKLLAVFAAALAVLVLLAVLYINGKLDLIHYDDGTVDGVGTVDAEEDQDLDTTGLTQATNDEMEMPEGSPFADEDVLNILLISTDERTDAVNDLADTPSARSILITHSASYKTSFAYNSWNRNYKMSMYSNRTKKFEAAVDELTGKQLTFANVVVCFANIAAYAGDSHDVQEVQYVEGGQAYLFTSGGVQTGRWEKDHPTHPIRLYTDAGEEMTLNRGKTYFALVDNDEWSNFSYQ